jgi:carbon starvation protein
MGFLAGANQLAERLAAGALPEAQAAVAPQLIFNQRLDAVLAVFFATLLWILIADTTRVCWRVANGRSVLPSVEAPYEPLPSELRG